MAYVSKIWVDRQTEYPTRRKLEFDDGSSDKIVTVSREEGTIYAAGDTFDANTMNSLESRIAAGIAEKQDILIPGNGIRIDQDHVISATGGGGGIEFTKIESGSLVSVNDAADLPVVDMAVEIKAVQSGSGDPSPNNVRPISGWANVGVARAGKNLLNPVIVFENTTIYTYDSTTGAVTVNSSDSTSWSNKTELPLKKGTYTINNPTGRIQYRLKSEAYGTDHNITTNIGTITLSADDAIKFKFGLGASSYPFSAFYQLEIGSTDTTYEKYNATTVTIALGQTVFGGERNITSGLQKITHANLLLSDATWRLQSINSHGIANFYTIISGRKNGASDLCDRFTKQTSTIADTTTEGFLPSYSSGTTTLYIRIYSTRASTVAEFSTWLENNETHFVYELAQPVTVQMSGTEFETILGINNIWADSGDILNLEYYTQSASDVRDFIIKDDVVSDQSSWSSDKITEELETKQDIIEAGDGIVINGNEISAVLYKEMTATLNVFSTQVVFQDEAITTNSTIDIYTSKYAFNPETVTVETGKITITFRQPEEQIYVKVRIS